MPRTQRRAQHHASNVDNNSPYPPSNASGLPQGISPEPNFGVYSPSDLQSSARQSSMLQSSARRSSLSRTGAQSPSQTQTYTYTQNQSRTETQTNTYATSGFTGYRRQEARRQGGIYESIMSPSGDDIYSPTSPAFHQTRKSSPFTRQSTSSPAYSPDSTPSPIYTPHSTGSPFYSPVPSAGGAPRTHRHKRGRSAAGGKHGAAAYEAKRRKREAHQQKREQQEGVIRKSDLFINIDGVLQDFLWEQKFKSEFQAFSNCVNPKFFALETRTDSCFKAEAKTALADTNEAIPQESWAMSSLLDAIPDDEALDLSFDDAALDSAGLIVVAEEEETKALRQEMIENKESLFLRRSFLVSNDLYTDGLTYKHGVAGAEKALRRSPPEELTVESLRERIDETFHQVKTTKAHPRNPDLKVKRVMPLVPNRDLWVHPYTQVKYDEVPTFPEEQKVPPVLVKATVSPYITAFAVYQFNDNDKAHALDRSYMWDNKGECSMTEEGQFRLVEWPTFRPEDGDTVKPVYFSQVSNKIRLRKLTARVPKQRQAYEAQLFGNKAMHISWRNPTAEEAEREASDANYMVV